MKKLTTILTIIFAITVIGYGQDIPDTTDTQKYIYCQIHGVDISLGLKSKLTIMVDDGEYKPPYPTIRDEKGKPKIFNSMIDALNYMSEDGWEFVQAYSVQNLYHFLLKKRKYHEKADNINE